MTSTYVSCEYNDLKDTDEMVEQVKAALMDLYKADGEIELKREWHAPVPTTWQEAYVRAMAIDFNAWADYERGEDEKIDWADILDYHAENEAKDKLFDAFHHMEVEVQLS